jgi:4-hydroxy-4-methyl-2-oxoglutarate aldolase
MQLRARASGFPSDLQARCRALGSLAISEVAGLSCSVDPSIKGSREGLLECGPAFPLECSAADDHALLYSVRRAPKNSFLLVNAPGNAAWRWSPHHSNVAKETGVCAVAVDGGVHETGTTNTMPVFGRTVSVRAAPQPYPPFSTGVSIWFSGLKVNAGDFVVADDDGIVILPAGMLDRILQLAESQQADEIVALEKLANCAQPLAVLGLANWRITP